MEGIFLNFVGLHYYIFIFYEIVILKTLVFHFFLEVGKYDNIFTKTAEVNQIVTNFC